MASKVATLVFIDHLLGGIGTQAYDFARLAHQQGIPSKIIGFTSAKKIRVHPLNKFTASFGPTKNGKELELKDCLLSTHPTCVAHSMEYLSQFDVRIWIGVAPHLKEEQSGEQSFYSNILTALPGKDIAFATDRYVDDLYPWIKKYLSKFHKVLSFADAYAATLDPYVPVEVVPIAPLDTWPYVGKNTPPSQRKKKIFWPHQWRGWKNIEMFLEMAPSLVAEGERIKMFASGAGFEYAGFARTPEYKKYVSSDVHNPTQRNPQGCLELLGFRPSAEVLASYQEHQCVPDLTGVSKKKQVPNSYVGNYQCATLEAMCMGTVVLKMDSTVAPHSVIPKEAVGLLDIAKGDFAGQIRKWLERNTELDKVSNRATEWLQEKCDPYKLFQQYFLEN